MKILTVAASIITMALALPFGTENSRIQSPYASYGSILISENPVAIDSDDVPSICIPVSGFYSFFHAPDDSAESSVSNANAPGLNGMGQRESTQVPLNVPQYYKREKRAATDKSLGLDQSLSPSSFPSLKRETRQVAYAGYKPDYGIYAVFYPNYNPSLLLDAPPSGTQGEIQTKLYNFANSDSQQSAVVSQT